MLRIKSEPRSYFNATVDADTPLYLKFIMDFKIFMDYINLRLIESTFENYSIFYIQNYI